MTRSLQAVTCRRPSAPESAADRRRLGPETSPGAAPTGVEDHPRSAAGFPSSPQAAPAGLLAVADVADARYRQPQPRASLDPVVTGNGDRPRFESFSGCGGGVYARLGVLTPGPAGGPPARVTATAVELAKQVGALLASAGDDIAEFEWALDGLVRHAYRDPDALREALAPVVARRWWATADDSHWPRLDTLFGGPRHGVLDTRAGLDLLLATLHDKVRTAALLDAVRPGPGEHECPHGGLSRVLDARLREVAYRLRTEPLPLLLATPTRSTGLLEPEDLVARLAEYRRLDARVCATDFAQALLRVRTDDRTAAGDAARRAWALGTREGARLARRLSTADPGGRTGARWPRAAPVSEAVAA